MGMGLHNVPLVGGLFENPEEENLQQSMEQARQAYAQYRPMAEQARLNALAQTASLFQPVNRALGEMYGPGAQMSMPVQSPLPEGMTGVGGQATSRQDPSVLDQAMGLPGNLLGL